MTSMTHSMKVTASMPIQTNMTEEIAASSAPSETEVLLASLDVMTSTVCEHLGR